MIPKTVTLLIFGAAIASGQLMPRLFRPTRYDLSVMPDLRSNGCPPAPELAPVICQFMQPTMGLHYKPALIAPSTYVPPLVVEKCDTTHLEIELPPKKHIVIPEPPILPPITIPKFPVPVIVEKPIPPPVPMVEPCDTGIISGGTAVSIPAPPALPPLEMPALPPITFPKFPVPVMIEKPIPPPVPIVEPCEPIISGASAVVVPPAPELPPLVMPALPEIAEQHGAYISEAGINEIGYQSMMIPELPIRVEPPMLVAPCPEDLPIPVAPIPEYKPLAPPTAPFLPPARFPEIPVRVAAPAPPMIIERPLEEPCITEEIVVPHPAPVIVPQPPRIPQPMQIHPEHVLIADPCEPSMNPVMNIAEHPAHFVGSSSYIPMPAAPGFLPARSVLVKENAIHRISAHHFKPIQNVGFMSLPRVRHM